MTRKIPCVASALLSLLLHPSHGAVLTCSIHFYHKVIPFFWVRDYETVKIEQDVPNEFLLVLDNGDLSPTRAVNGSTLERRAKGAYYKNLERKITLKKKRVNVRVLRTFSSSEDAD